MKQYLIRTLTDSTGTPFTHVTKARENETIQVVEAESREQALEKVDVINNITDKDKAAIRKLFKIQRILG